MAAKTIPIHPSTLCWVRENVGLSIAQAAKKLKVPDAKIIAWESGEEGIGLSSARNITDKYKVPLPVLYLRDIPKEWQREKPKDFRRPGTRKPYSYQLCCAIRDARERQSWMREYLQNENEKPLNWLGSFSSQQNVQDIAGWVLQWLGIDRGKIADLKNDKEALSYWTEKLETKRVLVSTNGSHSAHKIDRKEYSGLVLYDEYAPLILLNPADSPARRIFTLLHELAHLLLDDNSGVSQIDFRLEGADYDPIETTCNRIASNILIEDRYIKEKWNDDSNLEEMIESLASVLKVSRSAIAVKLKKLGFIQQTKLTGLLAEYQRLYLEQLKNRSSYGRATPDKRTLNLCGNLLTQTVLIAYEQGSVNATEVYDVLGIKLKYLGRLSTRLQFPLHRWIA